MRKTKVWTILFGVFILIGLILFIKGKISNKSSKESKSTLSETEISTISELDSSRQIIKCKDAYYDSASKCVYVKMNGLYQKCELADITLHDSEMYSMTDTEIMKNVLENNSIWIEYADDSKQSVWIWVFTSESTDRTNLNNCLNYSLTCCGFATPALNAPDSFKRAEEDYLDRLETSKNSPFSSFIENISTYIQ